MGVDKNDNVLPDNYVNYDDSGNLPICHLPKKRSSIFQVPLPLNFQLLFIFNILGLRLIGYMYGLCPGFVFGRRTGNLQSKRFQVETVKF